ncbi:MAG: tetratricopeptide repeat protein [Thermodesulfobacteriota bacterium]
MHNHWKSVLMVLCLCCFMLAAPPAWAQETTAGETDEELAPTSEAQKLYERGQFEMDTGNYADALDFFNKALALEPTGAAYQVARGRALFKLGLLDQAEAQFLKLVGVGGAVTKIAYVELGAVYGHAKKYQQAVDHYTKAIELDPGRANLYLARGSMYMELHKYPEAETDFQKAAQLNPELGAAVEYHRAMLSFKQENYLEAKERLDKAASMKPADDLAKAIKEFKDIVVKEERAHKPWSIVVSTIFQTDDNVTLEPLRGPAAGTDEKDYIFGINFTGTYFFENRRATYSGASYSFLRRYYRWHPEFDYEGHLLTLFYGLNQDPWYFHLSGTVGKYVSNDRDILNVISVSPTITRLFGMKDRLQLSGLLDHKMQVSGNEEDAQHFALSLTYFHTYKLPKVRDELGVIGRFGFKYEGENPEEDIGPQYRTYELLAGLSFQMPFKIEGDVGLNQSWIYYSTNPTRDGGLERMDLQTALSFKAGRTFADYYRLEFMYTRTLNDSSIVSGGIDPYEYHRDVVSLSLTASF